MAVIKHRERNLLFVVFVISCVSCGNLTHAVPKTVDPPCEWPRMVPVLRRAQRQTHKRINMLPDVQNPPGEKRPEFPPFDWPRMVPVLRGAQRHTHKRIHMLPDVQKPPGKKDQRFPLLNGKPKTNMVPNVQNLLGEKSPASPPFECSRMVPVLRGAQRQTHKRIHMLPDVQNRPPPWGKKASVSPF